MVAGYKKSITEKTEEFLLDLSMGHYKPSWIPVHKFGRNVAIPNGAWATIANLGAAPYPFPAAPTTVRIKAGGNAADTEDGAGARSVIVTGIDSNMQEVSETLVTAGASASLSTTTEFWRVYFANVVDAGVYATPYNTGPIVIENTAGTADLLRMEAEEGQTLLGIYSVPAGRTLLVLSVRLSVDANKAADVRLFKRENFDVVTPPVTSRRLVDWWDGQVGSDTFAGSHPSEAVIGPADIWLEARGSTAQTEVSANMEFFCYPTRT